MKAKASTKKPRGVTKSRPVFDLKKLPASVAKSPLKLRDWLDLNLPGLIGPRVASFDPPVAQRGAILTIRGANFALKRLDNEVMIGGTSVPVLSSTGNEIKALVSKDVNTGPVRVKVGARTSTGPHDLTIKGYNGGDENGPPVFSIGAGAAAQGNVNSIGTIRVLIVICQTQDLAPPNFNTVRNAVDGRWSDVQTFYEQASYDRTDVQFDIVGSAAELDGDFTDFVDIPGIKNIIPEQLGRVAAIAAQHAQDEGFNLNNYQMLCSVVFTNGQGIRAWGGSETQTFGYDDGLPTSDPDHININISLNQSINQLWIHESADWGRFAHEFAHNIVSAPNRSGDGTATLGEDVYGSDLVDSNAATAKKFEMMGNHDSHPIFTGYHLEKLGYYKPENIKELQWDRNPHSEEIEVMAHGLTEDTASGRFHMVKIKVSDALTYFVEVRQRPGTTAQIFDENIPIGSAANEGGVIVTRVIAGEMHNNQQTRFLTLMHDERVQLQGDFIDDPLRALKITVVNDSVQARPLICKVKVEWAQTIANDPDGAFDLKVEPWDSDWQTPDIWVDSDPFGVFDNDVEVDSQGRPRGNGDKPVVMSINKITARVHVSGAMGASNVRLTFYAVSPPGVGDNGNWSPISSKTIASIAEDGFADESCDWVPVVGRHTCLKVHASQQLGEISGDNNGAQENVFDFQSEGSSPAEPLFVETAVRNPLDEPRRISLAVKGLPLGWAAQIPHAWVWLPGRGEKHIQVLIWPTEDVNIYKLGNHKKGRLLATAPVNVFGLIERSYQEKQVPGGQEPGSRFYPIGGVLYRTSVRRHASIRIQSDKKGRKETMTVQGKVSPVSAGQRVRVEVLLPDGQTRKTVVAKTNRMGAFTARVPLLDAQGGLNSGTYRAQAFIFHASELANAASAVVFEQR